MSDQTNKNNNRYNAGQIIKSEMDSQASSRQPNVPSATITSASGNNNTASLLPPPPRLITYYNNNLGNPRDNSSSRIRYTSRFPITHTVVSANSESSNPVGFIQNQSAVDSGGGPEEYEDDEDEEIEVVETIPALITGSGIITLATDPSIFEHDFSNGESPISSALPNNNSTHFLGRLMSRENVLFMGEELVDIGRNSSRSTVTFHVGKNIFVSRKHMQIFFYQNEFYLTCLSKNGIFIDGVFTRQTQHPIRLPRSCNFRFPSTNIRVGFENLAAPNDSNDSSVIFHNTPTTASCSPIIPLSPVITTSPVTPSVHSSPFINVEKSSPSSASTSEELPNLMYAPITVAVGEDRRTPFPSPTGTISAANSCPPSPHNRPIFTEFTNYSTPCASTTTFTANDIFLPPASSSYGEHEKPPYSYAQLIVQSISSSPEKQLTLSGIYSFISKNYPYYRTGANKGWQNSIRHNLSLNRYFIKVPRSQDEPGKGSFWRIDPTSEYKLIDQSFRKRRQRGTQFPFGMPRSAPVSPSHIDLLLHFVDNSTENSPLHDITMQSAPGSPGNYHTNHSDPQSIDGGTLAVREPLIRLYPTTYIVSPNANCTTVKRERNDDSDDSPSSTREHTEYDKYDILKRPKYSDN